MVSYPQKLGKGQSSGVWLWLTYVSSLRVWSWGADWYWGYSCY